MPDEKLIAEVETILSEVLELGATTERTRMAPNLLVREASPAGLDGFAIIRDDRDGDNILAKKVPSVIYSDNDLVNVMFVRGGEAIAFQQGSQSQSGGIWGIVPSTSTDIFFDKGDVGIGKSVAPDARLELLDTAQAQLRLTFQEDTKFVDFTLDTNHDLTIKPSSTGQVIFQPTTDSVDFLQVLDADGGIPVFNVDVLNERVGIGTASPGSNLHLNDVSANADVEVRIENDAQVWFVQTRGSNADNFTIRDDTRGGNVIVADITGNVGVNTNTPAFSAGNRGVHIADITAPSLRLEDTNAVNSDFEIYSPAGINDLRIFHVNTAADLITIQAGGNVGIDTALPLAQLHVDQVSTTAAQPVLLLDQADVSEEMRQFETTIGVGNAIEAAGSKLLTITHFVKDTLPGGLTRYTPYGTISTTGPKFTKNETVTTQGLGANPDIFAFGFYEFNAADANLTQASTTQTFGTANISYAAHAFTVTGGAGSTDAGVVGLRVNGTSINDQGTRTPGDTETIIADITAVALDDYQETTKKWLGTVTYELFTVSGAPTVFSLDFNYGLAKYDDWFNTDFTITDIEAVGFAGANDSDFDIKLMHHQVSGWTYSAAAFTPITVANTVASLVTDHSTDDQLASSQHASWKRDNLSEVIDGANGEGFLIFVSSSANNAIEYLNLHIGVIF